jgi:hypothetical protein
VFWGTHVLEKRVNILKYSLSTIKSQLLTLDELMPASNKFTNHNQILLVTVVEEH